MTGQERPPTLSKRDADRANAHDFGAVGDGAADNTAALQAALDTFKCVKLRPRPYRTTAPLEIDGGHILLGRGATLAG